MMRSTVVGIKPKAPDRLTIAASRATATLNWADNSANETGFVLQRANDAGFTTGLTTFNLGPNVTSYADTVSADGTYHYRVMARNLVGDTTNYSAAGLNTVATTFPTMAMDSANSNAVSAFLQMMILEAPTNLAASYAYANRTMALTWGDASVRETGYVVKRAAVTANGTTGALTVGAYSELPTAGSVLAPDLTGYADTNVGGNTLYSYQVGAVGGATRGPVSQVYAVSATAPAAPNSLSTGSATATSLRLSWPASSSNYVTGYEIQRCQGALAVCGNTSTNWQAVTTLNGRFTARYMDTGLMPRSNYRYRIRAVVSALPGFASPWRNADGSTQ